MDKIQTFPCRSICQEGGKAPVSGFDLINTDIDCRIIAYQATL